MKNKIIASMLTFGLVFPAPIFAQDTEEGKYTHLAAGETAPFAGVLFNPTALAELLSDKTYSDEECDLEIEYQVSRARSEMQLQLDSLQISYDALE